MTKKDILEATKWEEELSRLKEAELNAKRKQKAHLEKCKHWTKSSQTDGATGSVDTYCEWCGEKWLSSLNSGNTTT